MIAFRFPLSGVDVWVDASSCGQREADTGYDQVLLMNDFVTGLVVITGKLHPVLGYEGLQQYIDLFH